MDKIRPVFFYPSGSVSVEQLVAAYNRNFRILAQALDSKVAGLTEANIASSYQSPVHGNERHVPEFLPADAPAPMHGNERHEPDFFLADDPAPIHGNERHLPTFLQDDGATPLTGDWSTGNYVIACAGTVYTGFGVGDLSRTCGLAFSDGYGSSSITGTTAETAFDKFYTMVANTFIVGRVMRVLAWGKVTNQAGATTLILRLRYGGVLGPIILAAEAYTPTAGSYWRLEADMVCNLVGVDGEIVPSGKLYHNATTNSYQLLVRDAAIIDTTTNKDIVVTAQWSAADASSVYMSGLVVALS